MNTAKVEASVRDGKASANEKGERARWRTATKKPHWRIAQVVRARA